MNNMEKAINSVIDLFSQPTTTTLSSISVIQREIETSIPSLYRNVYEIRLRSPDIVLER